MFKIGDKVRFKDEIGEGVIKAFSGKDTAIVVLPQNIEIPVPLNSLVKVIFDPDGLCAPMALAVASAKNDLPKGRKAAKVTRGREIYEVDLHIGSLVDSRRGLSNGEILNIQIGHFRHWMEKAIRDKAERIIFIHGVGEGVLKSEIRRLLASYPGISWHDASYRKYGLGATEVQIR